MTESEIIQGVIDLLSVKEQWTKWAVARSESGDQAANDYYGNEVDACDWKAKSWCLGGAVLKVSGINYWGDINPAVKNRFNRTAINRGGRSFVSFNNDVKTTHEDLMLFLKEALYDAQADEARANIQQNLDAIEGVL